MFSEIRVVKKKSLSDPVEIIPFSGQRVAAKKEVKEKALKEKSTADKKVFVPKKASEPTGKLEKSGDFLTIKGIKSNLNQGETKTDDDAASLPVESFTVEAFEEVWKKLTERLKEENNQTLYIAFSSRKPMLTKPYDINIELENEIQFQALEQSKVEILTYLRENLNNREIQLKYKLIDNQEAEANSMKYDNKEKFKKWAEKNPGLLGMQKKFNLDIDL